MLMPNIRLKADPRINDIPLASLIYTDPKVKEQTPFGFNYDDDFVVEVLVNTQGKAVDFSIPAGEQLPKNADGSKFVDTVSIFGQLKRLQEAQLSGEPINLATVFPDSVLTPMLVPYGIPWPRPTTGGDASSGAA